MTIRAHLIVEVHVQDHMELSVAAAAAVAAPPEEEVAAAVARVETDVRAV